jgi:hypothetical protein
VADKPSEHGECVWTRLLHWMYIYSLTRSSSSFLYSCDSILYSLNVYIDLKDHTLVFLYSCGSILHSRALWRCVISVIVVGGISPINFTSCPVAPQVLGSTLRASEFLRI